MRKKAEGITQTKRLCTFSFSFLFSSPHLSLSLFLFFQSRRRRWREDPRCRNPCVTDFLPVVQQSVCPAPRPLVACHPLVAFYKGSAVFDEFVFLIVPEEEKKKEWGGKKKRRKEPVQRLVGWLDGETPTVFRSLECPCARGNTNAGSYASCAIDLSLQGSSLALYSIDPGHSRTLILDLLCVYFYICIP